MYQTHCMGMGLGENCLMNTFLRSLKMADKNESTRISIKTRNQGE